jgi:nitrate reductase gamma subunit
VRERTSKVSGTIQDSPGIMKRSEYTTHSLFPKHFVIIIISQFFLLLVKVLKDANVLALGTTADFLIVGVLWVMILLGFGFVLTDS